MSIPPTRNPLCRAEEQEENYGIANNNDDEDDDTFSFLLQDLIDPNSELFEEIPIICSTPLSAYSDLNLFLDESILPSNSDNFIHNVAIERPIDCTNQIGQQSETQRPSSVDIAEGSSSKKKKLDHNAKERMRRLNLNASYLALRSMLPDSRRAKKKWSSPYIIDRAVDYIPELQAEIEKLTLQKNEIQLTFDNLVVKENTNIPSVHEAETDDFLTASINEVKKGETIVQICKRRSENNVDRHVFSNVMEKFESNGMEIISASALCVCEDRYCYHLHIQMREEPIEADYIATLHKKIVSWLS